MTAPVLTYNAELRRCPCRHQQAFHHTSNLAVPFLKPLFVDDIIYHFNLATCICVQSGLAIVFYCSYSKLRNAPRYRKLEWLVYRILLFTLHSTSRGIATKNEVVRHFSHVDKCYGLQEKVWCYVHMWLGYACITCLSDFGVCLPGNIMLEILPAGLYQLFLLFY